MSRSSAAAALRESFGDRRPPDISRKITACVSCRKLKVKCNVASSGPPCTRCRSRGLSCTVNKSLQMLLEDDASWKERIEQRLEALERTQQPSGPADILTAAATTFSVDTSSSSAHVHLPAPGRPARAASVPLDDLNNATLNLTSTLGMFPAASVGTSTPKNSTSSVPDLISRGVVSTSVAEECLAYFLDHLNHYLHGILSDRVTLVDVRARSSLLTAAICTVASFCSASASYSACYDAFVGQVSGMLFTTHSNYDDVRALCLAALWLDGIGPTLSGLAVRIGSQLDLHRCITKMPHTKLLCYDRTRLFYLVCLCDHHCSLKYGRPPMTQEWRSLKAPATFLHSEFSTRRDLSLISQLELWTTTRAVFEQFGADIESSAASQKLDEVDKLGQVYQSWHQTWCGVLGVNGSAGGIAELYYNCALLYLHSHIHRGGSPHYLLSPSAELAELHSRFRESAHAVLRIITESGLRLVDLPSYFGTMLAFATVSLIKIVREDQLLEGDKREILRLLRRLTDILRQTKLPQASAHPFVGIAKGLEQATESFYGSAEQPATDAGALAISDNILMDDIWNMDFTNFGDNWMAFDEH